jgi:transposase
MLMTVEVEVKEPKVAEQTARRQALRALARQWRAEGHTYEAIAKACGRSLRTVWLWANDVPRGVVR